LLKTLFKTVLAAGKLVLLPFRLEIWGWKALAGLGTPGEKSGTGRIRVTDRMSQPRK